MTTYLGLDLSLKSAGWALWSTGRPVAVYGHWELAPAMKYAVRGFVRLHKNLSALVREYGPIDVMAIEAAIPAHMIKGQSSAATIKALSGIEAHAMSFGEAVGARYHLINIGAWRRSFLGSMPANSNCDWKTLAQLRAKEFGMQTAVHDEAEAIGVLDYQLGLDGLTPPWRMAGALLRDLTLNLDGAEAA